jgi:mRNA interferase MazF
MTTPLRGEVWWVRFDPTVGSEVRKTRPAVVMSVSEVGRLPLRIIVPVTSWDDSYGELSWFVRLPPTRENGLQKESGADAFQVKSVSVERLVSRIGALEEARIDAIADAVALCVGCAL